MNPTIATIESASILANSVRKLREEPGKLGNRVSVGMTSLALLGSASTHFKPIPTLHITSDGARLDDNIPVDYIPAAVENTLALAVTAINLGALAFPSKNLDTARKVSALARLSMDLYTIARRAQDKNKK